MSAEFLPLVPSFGACEKPYIRNGEQPPAATAGGASETDLDPDALYRGVDLQLTYTYTAGTGGTLRPDNPYSLIREVQLIGGGGDILQRASGYELFLLAQIARGGNNPVDYQRVPATTTAVTNGRAILPLDFLFASIQPSHAGLLPARYLTAFKLRIDWAASLTDAIGVGMGGSPAVTASVVIMKRLVEPDEVAPQGYGSRTVLANPVTVASTTTGLSVKLEAGVRYAGFLFVNRDTANATLSDAAGLTGDVNLYLDSATLKFKAPANVLRQITRSRFPINYPGVATQFDLTGVYYADVGQFYAQDNDNVVTLGQAIDATQAREVKLDIDVTVGTSTVVRVIPIRYRAVAQSATALGLPIS